MAQGAVQTVADKVGGIKALAALAERNPKSVYRWTWPVDRGGTGGLVPLSAQRRIVANARAKGVDVSFADFAPPGEAA